jgi:photosystem II stability/assembly factor-like uncharacterized protein
MFPLQANVAKRHVGVVVATMACLATGCGSRDAARAPSWVALATVNCEPWRPSDADWSSLPTSRPANIGTLSASRSGRYLYSVGSWLDAGIATRQILRSPDLGETWCVLPAPGRVAEIVPSPASESVLYALTCADSAAAPRLVKTTDGGATWSAPGTALPGQNLVDCSGGSSLLQVSFTDPATLWLNRFDRQALYLSRDGGESWASVAYPPALSPPSDPQTPDILRSVDGLVIDPTAAARVLAWGKITSNLLPNIIGPAQWFSTRDAGQTWRELAPPPATDTPWYRISVLVDAASSLYLSTASVLLRSTDWGETWTKAGAVPKPFAHLATLGSRRSGQLFAFTDPTSDAPVWRTLDGGSTWSPLAVPILPAIDPVLALDGADVIVGRSSFGISTTTNGGKIWTPGPIVPSFGYLAQSPVDWRRIWAYGLRSTDGGLTWTTIGKADGRLLMDGANPDVAFSGVYDGSAGPERTEDGGQTWTAFSLPAGLIAAAATCRPPNSCLYVLLHEGGQGTPDYKCRLARSDDRGRTWTSDTPVPLDLCYFEALATSPEGPEHLAASCNVGVCTTGDRGQSWTSHVIGGDPQNPVGSIVLLHNGVVLATPSGGVVRSADGGATWTTVLAEGGQLVASNARPETVFLVTIRSNAATAIFRSDDSGATWNLASPAALTDRAFDIGSIADKPGGGFVASTTLYGLVQFK